MIYDYGLPYIEYIDEVQLYWYGQTARGLTDLKANNIRTYPPAIVQMHVFIQNALEARGESGLAMTVRSLRLLAVGSNLIGIILLGIAARLVAGDVAGWAAALMWAFIPVLVERSILAIPESFVYPLFALNLIFLALACLRNWRWAFACLGTTGLILLFEYRLFVTAVPALFVLMQVFARRYGWRITVVLSFILTTIGILAFYQIIPVNYQRWLLRVLTTELWNLPLLYQHFYETLSTVNLPGFVIMVGLGSVVWSIVHRHNWRQQRPILLGLLLLLATLIMLSSSAIHWTHDRGVRIQHVLPASAVLIMIMSMAFGQIMAVPASRWLRWSVVLIVATIVLGPQIVSLRALVNDREVQNWQVIIRQWADVNLSPGTVIVYDEHGRTFNPNWGGIQGRQWFDWWVTEDILEYPLEEWVDDRVMTYTLLPIPQQRQLESSEAGRDLLSQMLRLRDFVHPPTRREPEGIFYRLWRMEHELEINFGDQIILTGYDQQPTTDLQPGDTVEFTLYWQAATTPADNYQLFMHLVPLDEYAVLAQHDSSPAVPERLTLTWTEPSETLISPPFPLTLPPDLPSGEYRVMVGLYKFETGVRLSVGTGDAYELTRIQIP